MAEKEFFNHDGVIITSSRAVFRDTMYPISGISAVKQSQTVKSILQEKGYRLLTIGILMVVFGIIFGPSFNPSLVITYTYFMITISCILSAFLFRYERQTFHIGLHTSGTNIQVYSSPDRKEIQDIVKAINEAIIARG